MIRQVIERNGRRFVLVEEAELDRLERQAMRAESRLPPLPPADAKGNRPALEYIRASIARDVVRQRRALGLTQQQLAELAGLRQETLSRLESGKHSPNVRTVEKIDLALKRYAKAKRNRTESAARKAKRKDM